MKMKQFVRPNGQGTELADIQSVPPSRVHREESGEIWIADDMNDPRIIRVEDNFAVPLTKRYRLKDNVSREEAAKLFTDLLKQIGVEVRQTGGTVISYFDEEGNYVSEPFVKTGTA